MDKRIEYTNGELTIIWQPGLCQHAGVCVKMLPRCTILKKDPGSKSKTQQQQN